MRVTTLQESLRNHVRASLYSNAFFIMMTQGIGSLGGFVFWVIAARFFTTEAVGLAGAVIPAISLLSAISELGLGYGLIRFLPGAGNKAGEMMNSSLTSYLLTSLVASLIFLFGLGLWSPALLVLQSNPAYFVGFVAFTVVFGLRSLLGSVFIAYRSSKFTSFMFLVMYLSTLPLLILFTYLLNGFSGIVAAQGFAVIICLLVARLFFLPKAIRGYSPVPRISRRVIKEIIPYSIGNHIGVLLGSFNNWILPLLVVNILGAGANAYFYIAFMIGRIVNMIPGALATSAFAEGSNQEEQLWSNIRSAVKVAILLQIPMLAIILGLGDKLLLLFGTEYSSGGTTVLWLIASSTLPSTVLSFYLVYARVRKRLGIIVSVGAAATAITLGLTCVLAPRLDIEGVGVAFLLGQALVAVGIITVVLRKEPRKKLALIWKGDK